LEREEGENVMGWGNDGESFYSLLQILPYKPYINEFLVGSFVEVEVKKKKWWDMR